MKTFLNIFFQLGEEHEKTKESSECLRHLTQQAVVLQKKMNEIYKGNTSAMLPPIQVLVYLLIASIYSIIIPNYLYTHNI